MEHHTSDCMNLDQIFNKGIKYDTDVVNAWIKIQYEEMS